MDSSFYSLKKFITDRLNNRVYKIGKIALHMFFENLLPRILIRFQRINHLTYLVTEYALQSIYTCRGPKGANTFHIEAYLGNLERGHIN